MKVPKVTSILLVVLTTLTLLNFVLKYYTYFVLSVSSSSKASEVNSIAQETGEVPHPHELFVPLLTFIPGKSPVISRPWVLITSSFIEENFVGLTMSFMLFFYLGKYLETMWGPQEFTKFVFANIIVGNVVLYFYYGIKTMIFKAEDMEVPPVVISAMAINMGLFVAIKQRISNHYFIFFKGTLRLKVTFLPFLLWTACFILQLLSEEFYISWLLSGLGFVISWTYLRFFKIGTNERQSYLLPYSISRKRSHKKYKAHSPVPEAVSIGGTSLGVPGTPTLQLDDISIKGDRSEQFSLYTFFPSPLSMVVKLLSSLVFNTLVHYKVLDAKDFAEFDEEDNDNLQVEDLNNLQTGLFDLSPLKGAGNVSAIPHASSTMKKVWNWLSTEKTSSAKPFSIKSNMDKRRKLALKELE
ncbi:eukaryotic integral membrane protein-domain-containing protein [Scheffersomyces xylosifermentans]|uniref:eukaryotic integral membrane protein-domain-containing protein n=1 Tax=Scheffersomyces xylosifermentans TaxID=1304137 RepID=UPI00315CA306